MPRWLATCPAGFRARTLTEDPGEVEGLSAACDARRRVWQEQKPPQWLSAALTRTKLRAGTDIEKTCLCERVRELGKIKSSPQSDWVSHIAQCERRDARSLTYKMVRCLAGTCIQARETRMSKVKRPLRCDIAWQSGHGAGNLGRISEAIRNPRNRRHNTRRTVLRWCDVVAIRVQRRT